MKRAAIDIPSELMEKLANLAAERGVDVDSLAREALEEKVGEHRPRPRSLGMGASGFTDTARRAGEERPVPKAFGEDAIHTLDAVALIEDLPERVLCRGQVGTVVEPLAPNVFEIEFTTTKAARTLFCPSKRRSS